MWGCWRFVSSLALICLGLIPSASSGQAAAPVQVQMVWPISGTTIPDAPISSAYGPRQKASESFRYDYHQGIDLPTPIGTTLLAVMTGTVRIAGSDPNYADGIVQLDHGNGLYSNYIHVSQSLVELGQVVGIGQPVALSGVGESGFAHLHFEIREGSRFRRDAINPLRYLPYDDSVPPTIAITEVNRNGSVWVEIATPATALDINQIQITVRRRADRAIVRQRTFNYVERNRAYNGDPKLLDQANLDNLLIEPERFNGSSSAYRLRVYADHLGAGEVEIEACVTDIREQHHICTRTTTLFTPPLFLPLLL